MSSALYLKRRDGTVNIHKPETVKLLLHGVKSEESTFEPPVYKSAKHISPPVKAGLETSVVSSSSIKKFDWINEKSFKTQTVKEDVQKAVKEVFQPLWDSAEKTKEIMDYLHYHDMLHLRKKEVLHKNWSDRVYTPLRKRIINAVENGNWKEVKIRREELHQQYIEFVNRKGQVYLDTLDPTEYYALSMQDHQPPPVVPKNTHLCKQFFRKAEIHGPKLLVMMKTFRDPLLSQDRNRCNEDRVILHLATGHPFTSQDIQVIKRPTHPLVPLGRHVADSAHWLRMPLCQIDSPERIRSQYRMKGLQCRHSIDLGSWARVKRDPVLIEKEMNMQHKRFFPTRPPYTYRPVWDRESHTNQDPAGVDLAADVALEMQAEDASKEDTNGNSQNLELEALEISTDVVPDTDSLQT